MHRAVIRQIVTFLEKAHRSLELLGNKMRKKHSVHRSKSEHQIVMENSTRYFVDTSTPVKVHNGTTDDFATLKDFPGKQIKKDVSPDEIRPEKLALEAFRLLRTAQSLLNTREPDLVQLQTQPEEDIEFLAQIAKEFTTPEHKPQRATSFSLSPKLLLPENDIKISTAFNRKLSLQFNEARKCSKLYSSSNSTRGSVAESDTEFLNDTSGLSNQKNKAKKSNSSAHGSVSSMEDESGFSSMNSFQEVGLPLVNSTMAEEVSTKKALLQSMIHNNTEYTSLNFTNYQTETTILAKETCQKKEQIEGNVNDFKLWQKPLATMPQHKRWSSSPAGDIANQSLKVLWV